MRPDKKSINTPDLKRLGCVFSIGVKLFLIKKNIETGFTELSVLTYIKKFDIIHCMNYCDIFRTKAYGGIYK